MDCEIDNMFFIHKPCSGSIIPLVVGVDIEISIGDCSFMFAAGILDIFC